MRVEWEPPALPQGPPPAEGVAVGFVREVDEGRLGVDEAGRVDGAALAVDRGLFD